MVVCWILMKSNALSHLSWTLTYSLLLGVYNRCTNSIPSMQNSHSHNHFLVWAAPKQVSRNIFKLLKDGFSSLSMPKVFWISWCALLACIRWKCKGTRHISRIVCVLEITYISFLINGSPLQQSIESPYEMILLEKSTTCKEKASIFIHPCEMSGHSAWYQLSQTLEHTHSGSLQPLSQQTEHVMASSSCSRSDAATLGLTNLWLWPFLHSCAFFSLLFSFWRHFSSCYCFFSSSVIRFFLPCLTFVQSIHHQKYAMACLKFHLVSFCKEKISEQQSSVWIF